VIKMGKDEIPKQRTGKGLDGVIDNLLNMDVRKATKYIIKGILVAALCGAIALVSASIATNSTDYENVADEDNDLAFQRGEIGYQEWYERSQEIDEIGDVLRLQDVWFTNIARIGIYIGLVFTMMGFIAYATNKDLTDPMRLVSLIIATVIIAVILFTVMATKLSVTLG
jgi:hypothetical protein